MGTKRVVVVGGTSGIGLESAINLQSIGHHVTVAGRNKPGNLQLPFISVDVRDEDSVRKLFDKLSSETLFGLVYAAGVTLPKKSIAHFDKSAWENLFTTNVTGAILALKYAFPLLQKPGSRVVLVSSFAARTYSKLSGFEYTASKYALSGLTRQLAVEWAHEGIFINSVFPSMTLTPMMEKNIDRQILSKTVSEIPLKRLATPAEVAHAISYLLDENNSYMTGSGIDINGGQFLNG